MKRIFSGNVAAGRWLFERSMTFIQGLVAALSIFLMFLGIISRYQLRLSAFVLLVGGGLLLAIAYDALEKPLFFFVPLSGILCAFIFPSDSKALCSIFGMLLGIVGSGRCVKYYYQHKAHDSDSQAGR